MDQQTEDIIHEMQEALLAQRRVRITHAQALANELGAVLYGIWGHATGSGGKEYVVFRGEIGCFIVIGQDKDENWRTRPLDPEHTPNGLPVRSIEVYLAGH